MSDAPPDRSGRPTASVTTPISERQALAVIIGLLVIPVTAIADGATYTVVSLWGLFTIAPGANGDTVVSGYPLWRFVLDHPLPFSRLPSSIQAWPIALGFHLLAVGSAALGVVVNREDTRVTGGLLVLAGIASLSVTLGIGSRYGLSAAATPGFVVPIGALCTWACAIAVYGSALRGIIDR